MQLFLLLPVSCPRKPGRNGGTVPEVPTHHPLPFPRSEQPNQAWNRTSEVAPHPQAHPSLAGSMTQMPTPPPTSDLSRSLRFRAVNDPTHEQDLQDHPGAADPALAMDDTTMRDGHSPSHSHRADAGPELTRRAVGPRLYHKKSRMGCLRCKARRVKVSCLFSTTPARVGWHQSGWGYYICTSYHSLRVLLTVPPHTRRLFNILCYRPSFD